jgi:asparagine synthase (glutamine-hydrolysing)
MRMTRSLAHRGPDGEGFDSPDCGGRPVVHFGHRRLAVIDIEGGGQPMRSGDGQVSIVFNGEIYNFAVLRDRLESQGCRFRTRSDTEVLLYALASWSDEALPLLDGMFAFAAFDSRRSELILAIDRFGQKPLVWSLLPDGRLLFASELTALRHHPDFPNRLDSRSLCRMLAFNQTPAPETIWRGVFRLEPGSLLKARVGPTGRIEHHQISRYWKAEAALAEAKRPVDDDELLAALSDSVAAHLVADVPLGVFLSGGIDSTVVAALAARHRPIVTLCLGSDQGDYDESSLARRTADAIGSEHHELRLTADSAAATLEAVTRHLDEPLADAGCLPAWELFREARGAVTVAVGGDGGDELLEGYPTFLALELSRWLSPARSVAPLLGRAADLLPVGEGYYPLAFQAQRFIKGLQLPAAFRLQAYIGGCPPRLLRELVRADVLDDAGLDPHSAAFDADVYGEGVGCGPADHAPLTPRDQAVHDHLKWFLADDVLRKVDRMSMAHGLEVRAPLLGSQFAAMCLALRSSARRRGSVGKRPLRRWLDSSGLAHVTHRPKRGFAIPVAHWLRGPLRSVGSELFLSEQSPLREWCRLDRAALLWRGHLDGRCDARKELWALLTLGLWARHHLGRPSPQPVGDGGSGTGASTQTS